MFLDIVDFARNLLAKSPSVALLTWKNRSALISVAHRLRPAFRQMRRDTVFVEIVGTELDRESFSRKLLECLTRKNKSRICLFIHEIEPLIGGASTILNGFRERFVDIRALVLSIREDRRRDLLLGCPDLMDWVGLNVARAEDLGPQFRIQEVRRALRILEARYGLSSRAFVRNWSTNKANDIPDAWLWKELLAIRTDLLKTRSP